MPRTLLTPRWLALHALALAVIAGMVWLGSWQLDRFRDQRDRDDRLATAPVPLSTFAQPGNDLPDAAEARRVSVTGTYDADAQASIPGRVLDRTMGAWVVTTLETADGSTVPVVRGWVDEVSEAALRAPSGDTDLVGIVLPFEDEGDATLGATANLDVGELAYLGSPEADDELGLAADTSYGGYLLLTEPPERGLTPVPVDVAAPQGGVSLWQHLSYWAQWWIFAAAGVVFWILLARNAVRSARRTSAQAPAEDDAPVA